MVNQQRIGFIGGDKIALAIASAIIAKGIVKHGQIYASASYLDNSEKWRHIGAHILDNNGLIATKCDIIFICVESHLLYQCTQQIEAKIDPIICSRDKLFVSVVTGITLDQLELDLSFMKRPKIVQTILNIAVQVGEGCTVYTSGRYVDERDLETLQIILSSFGMAQCVPDTMMSALTALTTSGPAYVLTVIKALADGAVHQGIPLTIAMRLAAQTVLGTAKLVLQSQKHPAILRDEICTIHESAIVGVHELEKVGIRSGFMSAIEIATKTNTEHVNFKNWKIDHHYLFTSIELEPTQKIVRKSIASNASNHSKSSFL